MIENLPLFSVNVKIWKLFGFIEFQNYWRSVTFITIAVVMNLSEVMFFIKTGANLEELILASFMVAILFNSIVRIISVLVNQRDFVGFMEEIVQWLKDTEEQNDTEALKIFEGVALKSDKLSKLNLVIGSFGAFMTCIVPIVVNQRGLPYPVWIPWIDICQSPYYEIMFAIHIFVISPFKIVAYGPFTNLYISWVMFGTASLQVLEGKLDNLMKSSKTAEEIDVELDNCIQYHIKIIRFRDKLNVLVTWTNLLESLLVRLMLCVLLCSVLISLKIAESAYNTDWTGGSVKLKKKMLMIILRSQNALEISAGGMYPMTLETFKSLLSASYSYFTILKGMQQ